MQIAAQRVKGSTLAEIGKKTGLSSKTVEKHVASPEVKAWMQYFAERHEIKLSEAYGAALDTLTRLMGGADNRVALEAVDRLIHLLGTTDKAMAPAKGAPQDQVSSGAGTYTVAELYTSLVRFQSAQ